MNRKDFQKLATMRLAEAQVLLSAGHGEGAYYLAGYTVECGLKACIAKRTLEGDFPHKKTVLDSWTHNIGDLLKVAKLEKAKVADCGSDPDLDTHWQVVLGWSEESRYGLNPSQDPQQMVKAVAAHRNGVLAWLEMHW